MNLRSFALPSGDEDAPWRVSTTCGRFGLRREDFALLPTLRVSTTFGDVTTPGFGNALDKALDKEVLLSYLGAEEKVNGVAVIHNF